MKKGLGFQREGLPKTTPLTKIGERPILQKICLILQQHGLGTTAVRILSQEFLASSSDE